MKYVFNMPKYINQKNLEKLVRQYNRVINELDENDEVEWEFCGAKTVDTTGLLIITALSRQLAEQNISQIVTYDNKSGNLINFMERMDFFRICKATYSSNRTRYDKNTFCEISSVSTEADVNIPIYKLRKIIKSHSCPSALEIAATEIVMNAMHHAEATMPCYVVARVSRGNIDIAVCDTGMGIRTHLSKTFDKIASDTDAIKLALERYITGNRNGKRANSGMGLYVSKNIFAENKGKITIWSGEGQYQLVSGEERYYDNKPNWHGTIVSMRYILNNTVDISQIYRESEKDDNSLLDSIFK